MSAVPSSVDPVPSESGVTNAVDSPSATIAPEQSPSAGTTAPPPSYVKLAMRNMVRKGGKSLFHFALTSFGLLALLVGLAYLTH